MALADTLFQSVPKEVQVTQISIPTREKGRSLKAFIYEPKGLDKSQGKPAVHLNFHGSGFMIPCLGSDKEFCGLLASRLNMVVVDCDYRKAPEWPWPAAVQDAEDCIIWALAQSDRFDTGRASIGGFSAGANLALCASTLHGDALRAVISFYPPCDFTVDRAMKDPPPEKHSSAIPVSVARMFDQSYILQTGIDRKNPLISPVKADPKTFPPFVWLTCARGDTLYRDGKKLADQLTEAGSSQVEFHNVNGEGHAFDKACKAGTEKAGKKDECYRLAINMVERSWKGRENGAKL